ncbi:MAG: putative glycoside hydrolase, partial [Candidatus Paceibacterota bacterium]
KKTLLILIPSVIVLGVFFFLPSSNVYDSKKDLTKIDSTVAEASVVNAISTTQVLYKEEVVVPEEKFVATHVETPAQVKAIYMSSWVAGTPSFREKLVKIIDETEINSVVIDIKDYTGKVSFKVDEKPFSDLDSSENRISDVKEFISRLHHKGIYVIGRISVFQDPHLVLVWPEEAVKKSSDKTLPWKDHKGLSFIDAGSERAWEYNVDLAKISYEYGFDEINFDYIRFPSDGNMKDIYYPHSDGKIKHEVLKSFFEYINENLKNRSEKLQPTSLV